jgi:cytochrome c553
MVRHPIMPYADRSPRASRFMLMLAALAPMAALAADLAGEAAQLSADVPHGMVLYLKHCAGCHGRQAGGDGARVIPALAGQRESYLIAQLARFIDGSRPGSELHGAAMHEALAPPDVNRAQALRDLGAWLSRAAPNNNPERGSGEALATGKRAYVANACAGCHGSEGAGGEQPAVPALAGQHYSYLLAQLRGFSAGRLPHAAGLAPAIVGTAEQQHALADYLSRLPPPRPPKAD